MPAPSMPAALATGRVDAAALIHSQAVQARQSGEFVSVFQSTNEFKEVTGIHPVSAVIAGYESKLDANPDAYKELLRMLAASRDYALTHQDEVFPLVGREYNIDPAFFSVWFDEFMSYPVELSDEDLKAIGLLWEGAVELGLLKTAPAVESTVWTPVLDR